MVQSVNVDNAESKRIVVERQTRAVESGSLDRHGGRRDSGLAEPPAGIARLDCGDRRHRSRVRPDVEARPESDLHDPPGQRCADAVTQRVQRGHSARARDDPRQDAVRVEAHERTL